MSARGFKSKPTGMPITKLRIEYVTAEGDTFVLEREAHGLLIVGVENEFREVQNDMQSTQADLACQTLTLDVAWPS